MSINADNVIWITLAALAGVFGLAFAIAYPLGKRRLAREILARDELMQRAVAALRLHQAAPSRDPDRETPWYTTPPGEPELVVSGRRVRVRGSYSGDPALRRDPYSVAMLRVAIPVQIDTPSPALIAGRHAFARELPAHPTREALLESFSKSSRETINHLGMPALTALGHLLRDHPGLVLTFQDQASVKESVLPLQFLRHTPFILLTDRLGSHLPTEAIQPFRDRLLEVVRILEESQIPPQE